MNDRIALIWFSCFCCASENFRLMPAASAASLIDLVFAVRHSLSARSCEKPSVIFLSARTAGDPVSKSAEATTIMTAENRFAIAVLAIRYCPGIVSGRRIAVNGSWPDGLTTVCHLALDTDGVGVGRAIEHGLSFRPHGDPRGRLRRAWRRPAHRSLH